MDDQEVEQVDLGGLAVMLRRRGRAKADLDPTSVDRREPARIITMVWGDRYIADFLSITLPAILSPGNIPALAEHFACEFVIVTETRLFRRIAAAAAVQRLLHHCDLRLVPIDDLLSPWYGITLTYALVRGFADLGSAMVHTHLIFLNADFIVADGSYRKLAEKIRAGERLVCSPSYCMVLEQTLDKLLERYDATTCTLTLTRREMAALIIAHRHNTIRAKTVNQRLFRIHRYDQFYWYVDDHTILARQLPIAVVYMRPERVLTELCTFWDYGVVSEFCPTIEPCVLWDSDDFLMGELRTERTFCELLRLGWPSVGEIAADLSSFTTKDHRDYGRFTLVLHSADLPVSVAEAKGELAKFVASVYARLSPPLSYRDHPFWTDAFPRFQAGAAEQQSLLHARALAEREFSKSKFGQAQHRRLDDIRAEAEQVDIQARRVEGEFIERAAPWRDKLSRLEQHWRQESADIADEIDRLKGDEQTLMRPLDRRRLSLVQERDALLMEIEREVAKLAAACRGSAESSTMRSSEFEQARALRDGRDTPVRGASRDDPTMRNSQVGYVLPTVARLYRYLFGQLPHTTRWHPYHAMLLHALEVIDSFKGRAQSVLVLSSGPLGSLLVKDSPAAKTTMSPEMVFKDFYSDLLGAHGRFDLCVCDVAPDELMTLRRVLERIRPHLVRGAKIIVFHQTVDAPFAGRAFELAANGFPLFGQSRVRYSGTWPGALAARWFHGVLHRSSIVRVRGMVIFTLTLLIGAPLARIGLWLERRRDPERLPKHCISMTMEIDV